MQRERGKTLSQADTRARTADRPQPLSGQRSVRRPARGGGPVGARLAVLQDEAVPPEGPGVAKLENVAARAAVVDGGDADQGAAGDDERELRRRRR